jgi:hypothetical protein
MFGGWGRFADLKELVVGSLQWFLMLVLVFVNVDTLGLLGLSRDVYLCLFDLRYGSE